MSLLLLFNRHANIIRRGVGERPHAYRRFTEEGEEHPVDRLKRAREAVLKKIEERPNEKRKAKILREVVEKIDTLLETAPVRSELFPYFLEVSELETIIATKKITSKESQIAGQALFEHLALLEQQILLYKKIMEAEEEELLFLLYNISQL